MTNLEGDNRYNRQAELDRAYIFCESNLLKMNLDTIVYSRALTISLHDSLPGLLATKRNLDEMTDTWDVMVKPFEDMVLGGVTGEERDGLMVNGLRKAINWWEERRAEQDAEAMQIITAEKRIKHIEERIEEINSPKTDDK